jgi:metal-dependent amidase/aminoacylase/carboxypeptidase family protein
MSKQGFDVTKHYFLDTAWSAVYTHGQGGRTIGINSEMDALPDIGHACGHNLIAIAGVAVAVAIKAAMVKWDIPGKIILRGTPGDKYYPTGLAFKLNMIYACNQPRKAVVVKHSFLNAEPIRKWIFV